MYAYDHEMIWVDSMLVTILVINVAAGLGIYLNQLLGYNGIQLLMFVTCLFAGILLTNTVHFVFKKIKWPTGSATIALVSDLSLGLLLAISLMSLLLWTLADLAVPIILLLLALVIVVTLFVIFVVFSWLGKTYDAAIFSTGYAGLGLGATPTAIANMTAATKIFGASPKAIIIVPLVGAIFYRYYQRYNYKIHLNWSL